MIQDAAIPGIVAPAPTIAERGGVCYTAARWTADDLVSLAQALADSGRDSLARISSRDMLQAWSETVARFRDPRSRERQTLDPALTRLCQLSPPGLSAGLEAVLGGVRGRCLDSLAAEAEAWIRRGGEQPLVVISLASNLPALAVQPLLPALLLRCPVLLKSPSSEPLFAPAFVSALSRRLPALAPAVAAITWKGGDRTLEEPLYERADRVLAYGDADTLDSLAARLGEKLFAYGPRTSLAAVARESKPEEVAGGLARDIALFDQRGCLSVQAVFTDGDPRLLARALAAELENLAVRWPPGVIDPAAAAAVQQMRTEATLLGLDVSALPLTTGTVIVDPQPSFRPGPGLRTVRIHPLEDLEALPEILVEWSGRLQGAALSGRAAWRLRERLQTLGFCHFAAPGGLQTPDINWHNGGVHPFEALTGGSAQEP